MTASARILVVEDEATLRSILATVLSDAGHDVTAVASGEEALALLPGATFDAVITDKNLPGMTGLELSHQVRARLPDVRLMMVTGYPSVGAAVEALDEGFLAFLVKPFRRLDEATEEVGRVLRLAAPGERHRRSRALKARLHGDRREPAPDSALLVGANHDVALLAERVGAARTVTVKDLDEAQMALGQAGFAAVVATEVSVLIETHARLQDAALALAADASFADVLELIRMGGALSRAPQVLAGEVVA